MKRESRSFLIPIVVVALVSSAGAASADQCIFDDLIVDGSACIGFDCVCNSEVFSFDTLRLKENNLRITFIDTSVAAAFPRGDWQIRANESTNGGANEFAVDWLGTTASNGSGVVSTPFAIEGDAPNNAVYVDDGGRVGFKTATPVVELHSRDGDTPTLRLEQDGSSGFEPQTWDVAGNETNFFIRDVTNGSTLPLRIRPGAPSNAIFVDVGGDVGVGSSSPDAALDVEGDFGSSPGLRVHGTNADNTDLTIENSNAVAQTVSLFLDNTQGSPWEMRLNAAGNLNFTRQGLAGQQLQINGTNGNITTSDDLSVGGNLSKGGGAFKIDHPLDPENRYLQHSFVESPDMLNVYNGNVELDREGRGLVELPVWFEALNRDYRYQLTAIGAQAPGLYIASGIAEGRFEIAGGVPGQTVSWLVTGVRRDAFAEANRIEVEPWKAPEDRGAYLHPEAFNLPPERRIGAEDRTASAGGPAPSESGEAGTAKR